jgi:hypothetical protein
MPTDTRRALVAACIERITIHRADSNRQKVADRVRPKDVTWRL